MDNCSENATLNAIKSNENDISIDNIEKQLQSELEEQFSDLDTLSKEYEHINNPDCLGETVMNVIWEQFMNQVAATAGEEFIKENRGLTLDLRNSAHIQTPENFAAGKISTHNHISNEQLQKNYDRYKNTPHNEFRKKYVNPGMDASLKRAGDLKKQGIDTVKDIYTGRQIPTATKLENGKNNPKAAQREHVKSSAEIYSNPSLQMAYTNEQLAGVINDPKNLQGYTTAERNNRKSDNSASEMSASDKTKHWEKADEVASGHVKNKEKEGENRLIQEGRKTQREESFRIGGKILRTALMSILAALVKEIIGKLVLWFKSAAKSVNTLIEHIKLAIQSFGSKLKELLVSTSDSVLTTILTSIIGPVVGTIKKFFTLLKQGWKSLKEAIQFLKKRENAQKPLSYLLPQVGIIITTGLSGMGSIVLGDIIEKGLISACPPLEVDIPILGSPASLIGMLMGAIVSGVIGAIAINLINKYIAKRQKNDNLNAQIDKKNAILATQDRLLDVKIEKLSDTKNSAVQRMAEHRKAAEEAIRDSLTTIFYEDNDTVSEDLSAMKNELASLLN